MLDPVVMWGLGAAVVVLPIVLAYGFHGEDRADSRGRRLSRRWRGRRLAG